MGRFPCEGQGSSHEGRVRGLYPSLLIDGDRYSRYMRMCPRCLTECVGRHRREWQPRNMFDEPVEQSACSCCGEVAKSSADLRPFYVTMYTKADSRVDYEAFYCDACAGMVRQEFNLEIQNGRR